MNIAKLLLTNSHEYNGHKQFEVEFMSLEYGREICKALGEMEPDYSFVMEVWPQGFSIYQKDFWTEGEHPSGHRDRLIMGVENYER